MIDIRQVANASEVVPVEVVMPSMMLCMLTFKLLRLEKIVGSIGLLRHITLWCIKCA